MPDQIAFQKQQLRRECKRIRSEISPGERQLANQAICQRVAAWQVFNNAVTILAYLPMRSEVDLTSLLDRFQGKRWAVPRIRPGGQMAFHVYDPTRLVLHPYGMLEPEPDCPAVSPESIQLALVPGLSFDMNGWRLGYGGGFYDRFLGGHSGVSAGICFQPLYLDHVPHARHDIPMDFVITEKGIKQPKA